MAHHEIPKVRKPENFDERSRRVGTTVNVGEVKSRSVLAAERQAARLGKTLSEFTYDVRKRLRESSYPGPECLEPYEVEQYTNEKLADERLRHAEECIHCDALLKSTKPQPGFLEEILEEVRGYAKEIPDVSKVKIERKSVVRYALAASIALVALAGVWFSRSSIFQTDHVAVPQASLITSFKAHSSEVTSVAYSPDESMLATGGKDRTVKLWDLSRAKPQQEATLTGHTGAVWSIAFSPDGRTLATASKDETVRLWDIVNMKLITVIKDFPGEVKSAGFSPDGKLLVTAMSDGTVDLWDLKTLSRKSK